VGIRSLSSASISTGAKRSKFWDQTSVVTLGFESIATQIASGSSTTITFSGIPSGYKYLQLHHYFALTSTDSELSMRFNSDSGSNYTASQMYGYGTNSGGVSTYTDSSVGVANLRGPVWFGNSSSGFVSSITHIYDYSATDKVKTHHTITGGSVDSAGSVQGVFSRMGLWDNSSTAVTSITLTSNGGNILSGSHFALYGIKG
jgi:hypothetical protein